MKQNPGAVSAAYDEDIIKAILSLWRMRPTEVRPTIVIETGTYHGLGTTQLVLEAERRAHKKPGAVRAMYTIEADANNAKIAKGNLKDVSWVKVIHGSSVDIDEACRFIESDEMLRYHENYPDILFDAADPIPFYLSEVKGALPVFGGTGEQGQNAVLESLISKLKGRVPLFVLDSCGGIGYLEFQTVVRIMDDRLYYTWLHDIGHVKHFRSYRDITADADTWDILAEKAGEWVLARHKAK